MIGSLSKKLIGWFIWPLLWEDNLILFKHEEKILNRFVVAVVQKNNLKSATEKYEYPLIEINKYLKLQIQMQKKETFQVFKLPDIPHNYITYEL